MKKIVCVLVLALFIGVMFCSCGTSNAKFTKLFQNDKVSVIQDTENGSINEKSKSQGLIH